MNQPFKYIFILLFTSIGQAFAQKITVSGTVRDATSGELLIGASVSDSIAGTGVQTNAYGFFSIEVPSSGHHLKVSYVGYLPTQITSIGDLGFPLEVKLYQQNNLNEISIRENKLFSAPIGSLSIPIHRIKALPALLGEVDVLKALSYTPGVSTGTEGSAGLYIRGGTPDQNLILLDEVPVYNVMHLGGFFSVFNPTSLKSVDLYKGAFPARYGGRLASVIDLTMKDGNNQKFGGEVGIGLLNQKLTLEGPLIKNKASFIISGRVSTLGLTSLFSLRKKPSSGTGEERVYRFYDLNAKFNYQINKTDQVYISLYNGFDRFKYIEWSASGNGKETETAIGNNWGNTTATLRYSKVFSQKLFARFAVLYSRYTSEFTNDFQDQNINEQPANFYRYTNAGVRDWGAKIQFDYFPVNRLGLKFGVDGTRHSFSPFVTKSNYNGLFDNSKEGRLPAYQLDLYVDGDIAVISGIRLNPGLRYSIYRVSGRTFYNPEPRLGLSYSLSNKWKLKAGFSVMNQYLHQLTNNGFGFGYDAWVPSTDKVVPSRARQISLGLYKIFPDSGWELSLEAYVKRQKNLIDYPDGTNFTGLLADSWDSIVIKNGIGRGKGLEFMVAKNVGKFKGSLSYTLSKSERRFTGINDNSWFPMKYDRRHNVSITAGYAIGNKWTINSAFVYQTGHAVTLPVAATLTENNSDPKFIYDHRNNGRMPSFHRLDIGAVKSLTTARKRNAELGIGLYNVYNRKNPLYLDLKIQRSNSDFKPTGISIKQVSFLPILPYISYTLKF
ncbi:TonB-dependent receptor [Dyadobacter jiangsuensis]|uniref:Outer membrane receptor for ferrienterochelin and colicin n=1 Tax=Dyadobacter jiangsuensis TaxID=1591085 RepID=A0A2P8FXY0_9BACT|nr:TonB-dependent receptor plug domain-containing protein [Dyadobacter jiangsuensis]PSL26558.1 outer membrane receptor for ferrienterochelin and colicin [Dyadobacter jiangsuensis]